MIEPTYDEFNGSVPKYLVAIKLYVKYQDQTILNLTNKLNYINKK